MLIVMLNSERGGSMKRLITALILGLLTISAFNIAVVAQITEEPPNTLEGVASGPANFYRQPVTLHGYVSEFLSSGIFVIGENAVFDNDQLLVVNNTGELFDLNIQKGAQVQVTGVVYESLSVLESVRFAEQAQLQASNLENVSPSEPVVIEEPEPFDGHGIPALQFIYDGYVRNEYNAFTILVVENIADVIVMTGADGEVEPPEAPEMTDEAEVPTDTEMTDEAEAPTDTEMTDEVEATEESGS